MAAVSAVPASSVLVLRDAVRNGAPAGAFEVLMMRRHQDASFVPDAWVFPGGVLEDLDREVAREHGDDSRLGAMRVAGVRELFEETGVWLGTALDDAPQKRRRLLAGNLPFRSLVTEAPVDFGQLVWTSHWITPEGVPRRFDTFFFLAKAPAGAIASIESDEAVDLAWVTPEDALANYRMVFPTIRNLEAIRGFTTVHDLIESRRGMEIRPVQPVIVDGRVTLP